MTLRKYIVEKAMIIRDLRDFGDKERDSIIDKLAEWYKKEWGHFYDDKKDWKEDIRQGIGSSRDTLPFRLVLLDKDGPIGTVSVKADDLMINERFVLDDKGPWLSRFYIEEGARNKGYGFRLVAELTARLEGLGYTKLYVFHSPGLDGYYSEKLSFKSCICSNVAFNAGGIDTRISIHSGSVSEIKENALSRVSSYEKASKRTEEESITGQTALFNQSTILTSSLLRDDRGVKSNGSEI